MYQKGRKTEAGARRARGHKIWSQCIFFVIWDLIHRLQLAKNCDLKFCLYQLPLMGRLQVDYLKFLKKQAPTYYPFKIIIIARPI